MECKDQWGVWCTAWARWDLIETLWNVKFYYDYQNAITSMDLIETLWNVKKSLAP